MNKTIIALLGIVVVGGAIAFVVTRPKDAVPNQVVVTDATNSSSTSDLATPAAPAGKKMAFGQFIKQGGSYQCTVNQYIDAGYSSTTKGTVYISDSNIRGDFATQVQGMKIDTSFILRDGFAYTWTSLANTGYKSKVTPQANTNTATDTKLSGSFNWNADMIGDYDCAPWTVNTSVFAIPANITFQEIK
jgi:hypothetical protein